MKGDQSLEAKHGAGQQETRRCVRTAGSGCKEMMHMESEPKRYKPGHWVVLGTVIGAFIGLLIEKFAIGFIFGFFVGLMIDSAKRKSMKASREGGSNDDAKN
jgi:uncharacterized membrane protein YjjP (DUF1212 family)